MANLEGSAPLDLAARVRADAPRILELARGIARSHRAGEVLNHIDGEDIEGCDACPRGVTFPCGPYKLATRVLGAWPAGEDAPEPPYDDAQQDPFDNYQDEDYARELAGLARPQAGRRVPVQDDPPVEMPKRPLYQSDFWVNGRGRVLRISEMEPRYAANCYRLLVRKAAGLEFAYGMAELSMAPHGEMALDDWENGMQQRAEDPEAWLLRQPQFQALFVRALPFVVPAEMRWVPRWRALNDVPLCQVHALRPDKQRRAYCEVRATGPVEDVVELKGRRCPTCVVRLYREVEA